MFTTSHSRDDSNQFIRPKFDLHSTSMKLASRGEGFAISVEFANAISGGIPMEFTDALLEAVGNRSEALKSDDLCAIVDLYNAVPSTHNKADAAAEILALSADIENDTVQSPVQNGMLLSPWR